MAAIRFGVHFGSDMKEMKVRDVMTKGTRSVSPQTPIIEAAGLMRLHDIGVLPVLNGTRLVGMITDRDIVVQVVADGDDVRTTPVSEAMSIGSISILDDEPIEEAAHLMEKYQVRRLPVLNRESKLVGILSLGDLAVDANAGLSGQALKEVSEPAAPLL
jgi:CBS domain-containing protein